MTEVTPRTVRAACRVLAVHRDELTTAKSAEAAINVQVAKRTMNDAARELRATFEVLPGGKS